MSKLIVRLTFLLLATLPPSAQQRANNKDPVHFTYTITPGPDNTSVLHVTAILDGSWHIYAQLQPKDAISEPTKIKFTKNPLIVLSGQPKEIGKKETYTDRIAGITQYQYEGKVDFQQTFTLRGKVKTTLAGTITYQACTVEMCLPPKTIPFSVAVPHDHQPSIQQNDINAERE